eukprot:IDg4151t1
MPALPTTAQPSPHVAPVVAALSLTGATSPVSTSSTHIPSTADPFTIGFPSKNVSVIASHDTSAPVPPSDISLRAVGAPPVVAKAVCGAKTKKGKLCQNPIITRFGICPVHASLVGGVRAKRVAAAGGSGGPSSGGGSSKKRRKSTAASSSSKRVRQEPPPPEHSPLSVLDAFLPLSPVSLDAPPVPLPVSEAVDTLRWEPTLALEELYPAANVQDDRRLLRSLLLPERDLQSNAPGPFAPSDAHPIRPCGIARAPLLVLTVVAEVHLLICRQITKFQTQLNKTYAAPKNILFSAYAIGIIEKRSSASSLTVQCTEKNTSSQGLECNVHCVFQRMVLRVLNVAEKPSAAKEIVGVLKQGSQVSNRNGFSPYNRIFEFDMALNGAPTRMVFTSVSGHLKGSEFEARYRKWGSCDPAQLLDPSVTKVVWDVMEDKEPLVRTLRAESQHADWLVLWLDCDSEGEKIAADVRDVCLTAKRSLVVKRARFSAMTPGDLLRAIAHLEALNDRVASMVETRQEIDLRAGSAYTRFLTTVLERFDLSAAAPFGSTRAIVSYGPCQFPTLGLVVDRWLSIENFVRRPFWVFVLVLRSYAVTFKWTRKHLFDEYTAHTLYELAVEQAEAEGSFVHVERIDKRRKSRWHPLPLSTVDLQKAASRILRISSHCLMEVAESLYNKSLISYPRTETDQFNTTYDLKSLIQKHSEIRNGAILRIDFLHCVTAGHSDFRMATLWGRDDGAHPPIHPTNSEPPSFDSQDHMKVY